MAMTIFPTSPNSDSNFQITQQELDRCFNKPVLHPLSKRITGVSTSDSDPSSPDTAVLKRLNSSYTSGESASPKLAPNRVRKSPINVPATNMRDLPNRKSPDDVD